MQKIKQGFQTDLFHEPSNIMQHEEGLQYQNNNFSNHQLSYTSNSFISIQNVIQAQNQNIIISDRKQPSKKNILSYKNHNFLQKNTIFQNTSTKSKHSMKNIQQTYSTNNTFKKQNSSEINHYNQNSSNSFQQNYDKLSSINQKQQFSSIDQEYSTFTVQRDRRKKSLLESIDLDHKDQMILGSKVISGLQKNIVSLPFRQPVDIVGLDIPDYLEIVKQPMDLRTIKKKLSEDSYADINQIYTDIELIISNSLKYNELNLDFIRLTKNFEKSYNKIRRDCQRNMKKTKLELQKKSTVSIKNQKYNKKQHKSKQYSTEPQNKIKSGFQFSELSKLAKRIRSLLPEQQIQIFKKIGIKDTMTIDIKCLSGKEIKSLIKEVNRILQQKQALVRNQQKKQYSNITTCDFSIKKSA